MRKSMVFSALALLLGVTGCSSQPVQNEARPAPATEALPTAPSTPTDVRAQTGEFFITATGEVVDMNSGGTPPGSITGEQTFGALLNDTMVTVVRTPARTTLKQAQQTTDRECKKAAAPVDGTITNGEEIHLDGAVARGCSVTMTSPGSSQRIWYFATAKAGVTYVITIQTSGKPAEALPRVANNWHWTPGTGATAS